MTAFLNRPAAHHLLIGSCILFLGLLTWGGLDRGLVYDESIYLNVARAISRTGLPYRTGSPSNLAPGRSPFAPTIFSTSPPLVMYAAALPVRWTPHEARGSRILYMLAFILPFYLLVPLTAARGQTLPSAAYATLLLASSGQLLFWTPHIVLDIPLGYFSLLTLWLYTGSLTETQGIKPYLLGACLSMAAATWTKYQAVVIPASILLFVAWESYRGSPGNRRREICHILAVSLVAAAGLTAVIFLFYAGDPEIAERFKEKIRHFADLRTGPRLGSPLIMRSMYYVLNDMLHMLGPSLIVLASVPFLIGGPPRRFTRLLGAFCLSTAAFNFLAHRFPGAGNRYLIPMFAPLCILAGKGVELLLEHGLSLRRRCLLTALIAVHVYLGLPGTFRWPDMSPPRAEAQGEYIRLHARDDAKIFAFDAAPEFHSGVPTGLMQYWPPGMLLAALQGDSNRVEYVVLPAASGLAEPPMDPRKTLRPAWPMIRREIETRFRLVELAGDTLLYERLRAPRAAPSAG